MRSFQRCRKWLALLLAAVLALALPGCSRQPTAQPGVSYAQLLGMMNRSVENGFDKVISTFYWWGTQGGRIWAYGWQAGGITSVDDIQLWVASANPDGSDLSSLQLLPDESTEWQTARETLQAEHADADHTAVQELYGLPFDANGEMRPVLRETVVCCENGWQYAYDRYTLCSVGPQGQLQRGPVLQIPEEYGAEEYTIPPESVRMAPDGSLILQISHSDLSNGECIEAFYLRFSATDGRCTGQVRLPDGYNYAPIFGDACWLEDGSLLLLSGKQHEENCFFRLQSTAQGLQLSDPVVIDTGHFSVWELACEFLDAYGQQVYLVDNEGIFRCDTQTGATEEVLLWENYGLQKYYAPRKVFVLAEDQFLLVNSKGEMNLLTVTDADLLADRPTVTLSLLDNGAFANGVNTWVDAYNSTGPEVYIKTVDYSEATAKAKGYESGLDMLQDDLRKGAAPDILLLPSGFPSGWFTRRGQFIDLAPYLDADEDLSREDLLPGILQACEVGDTLPTLPLAFQLLTLVGAADVVGSDMGWSWQQFDALCAAHPQADPYYPLGRDPALLYLVQLGGTRYVDYAAGQAHLDTPDFVQRLQSFAAYEGREDGYTVDPKPLFANGDALLEFYFLSGYRQLLTLQYIFDGPVGFKGFPTDDGRRSGAVALSSGQVAINQSCKDPAAAWAFLRTLFGEEAQETVSGFPVRRSALQAKAQVAQQVNISAEFFDVPIWLTVNENQLADWQRGLTQEETDQITALVEATCQLYQYDGAVAEILWEEADYFYNGARTAAEAAALMQNRVQTYLDEQG